MTADSIDITKTRAFGIEKYLVKQVRIAIGVLALGILAVALSRGDDSDHAKGLLLGWMLIGLSIIYIGYALHRRAMPKKPLLELSAEGILYRIAQDQEFRVPWREVQGLGLVDIDLGRGGKLRDVTVACVSESYFDANVPVKSWWKRGPGWRHNFIRKGDIVQIALHHDVLSVPADELWNEVETRWRVLSGHSNAPILAVPRLPEPRYWIGGWTPSPATRRAGLTALAILAMPAIYFWHWPVTWFLSPDVPDGAAGAYLQQLLDRGGVTARIMNKDGIVVLRGSDLSSSGPARCSTEIARDPNRGGFGLPLYTGTTWCTASLTTAKGLPATAIFRLVVETTASPDWQGKMEEYRSLVPGAIDDGEADAALCRLGFCASG